MEVGAALRLLSSGIQAFAVCLTLCLCMPCSTALGLGVGARSIRGSAGGRPPATSTSNRLPTSPPDPPDPPNSSDDAPQTQPTNLTPPPHHQVSGPTIGKMIIVQDMHSRKVTNRRRSTPGWLAACAAPRLCAYLRTYLRPRQHHVSCMWAGGRGRAAPSGGVGERVTACPAPRRTCARTRHTGADGGAL